MSRQIFRGVVFLIAAIAVIGCTDMTTQQYHDQQVQDQLEQDNAVAGTYNGTINSLDNQISISAIQITIDSGAQPIPSSDGTTTASQAILTGSVRLIGATTSEAPFTAGYAYDTGGALTGTITIADAGLTLQLKGTINGSSLTGTIVSNQHPDDGGTFTTVKNGSLPTVQGSTSGQVPSNLLQYRGTGTGTDCVLNGDTCDVRLSIDETASTSTDIFADTLVSASGVIIRGTIATSVGASGRLVEVPFTFGGSNMTTELDKRNGTLTGKGQAIAGGTGIDVLNCIAIGAVAGNASNGNNGWSCTLDDMSFRVTPSAAAVH